jgi:hypothetical protein
MTKVTAVLFGTRSPEEVAWELRSLDLVEGEIEVLRGQTPNVTALLFFIKGRPDQKRSLWVLNGAVGEPGRSNAERTVLVGAATHGVADLLETLAKSIGGALCRRGDRPEWQAFKSMKTVDTNGQEARPEELDGIVDELSKSIRRPEFITDWRAAAEACAPAPEMGSIRLKTSETDKRLLAESANTAGMSLSAFVRSAATSEAFRIFGKPRLVHDRGQEATGSDLEP